MSPLASQSIKQIEKFKKKQKMVLDGKLAMFKDFEILEVIGEGSFGRVYKCKKRESGQILALKVMKK
jgi:serine/threonine protein kinase